MTKKKEKNYDLIGRDEWNISLPIDTTSTAFSFTQEEIIEIKKKANENGWSTRRFLTKTIKDNLINKKDK